MFASYSRRLAIVLAVGMLGITSCGKHREPVYPVHGQIFCQGKNRP